MASGAAAAAFSFGHHDGSATSRVTYRYQPMKTTLMANADSPRRSQKAAVSAGSSASEAARGRENGASKGDIGASNGEIGAARLVLTASRAEGPVGMKPGKRPAQPLQNIALSRFRLPQVLHTTDMSKLPE
ncbi:hypothetical protein [Variovorax sp. CF079]|uniref:hypothetical protein n=1 Tax=Variovorax sp. CF079 TaxID=1882774 RepID=UPI001480DF3B|nr:hypothetical protein [Variovorax sp. CF079]